MDYRKCKNRLYHWLSLPFIYMMIVPFLFFDIMLEIYHQICFRLYGLTIVNRRNYIKIDRHKLDYLNPVEKINCSYCGYANGFIMYAQKIIGETEKYWCGIKHSKDKDFVEPPHHKSFVKYNNKKSLDKKYPIKVSNK